MEIKCTVDEFRELIKIAPVEEATDTINIVFNPIEKSNLVKKQLSDLEKFQQRAY